MRRAGTPSIRGRSSCREVTNVADVGLHDLHAGALAGIGGEVISACTVSVSAKVPSALLRRPMVGSPYANVVIAQAFAERERRILGEVGVPVAVLAADLVVVDRQLAPWRGR